MKKCRKCGSDTFIVLEYLWHYAAICGEDKELYVYKNKDCQIDRICCKDCEEEYLESDFSGINFQ